MYTSTVRVQYGDGSPGRHLRVVLGFAEGNTREAHTDDYGEALVEHASRGRATVYVSGISYHTFHAPGRTAVTIRT